MGSKMKELVEFIVVSIVSQPEEVEVQLEETSKKVQLWLKVAPDDVGKVIGRRGRIVNSIRSLVRVLGTHHSVRVELSID